MQARQGDTVRVHYSLKDSKGQVVESTYDSRPIQFTIGEGVVIPGFENNIVGMSVNESKTITIAPEDGYGIHDKKKIFEFERARAPEDFDPQLGQTIQMHRPDGKPMLVTVIGRTEKGFIMDANHPLAGKELTFDLKLVEILDNDASTGGDKKTE